MKFKKEQRFFLIVYAVATALTFFVGVKNNDELLLGLSPIIMLVGFSIITSMRLKHIIKILKKNNLWEDDL